MQNNTLTFYNEYAPGLAEGYEKADLSYLHSLILREFSKGDTVLEIGTGSGRDAAFMKIHGIRVTGIDGVDARRKSIKKWVICRSKG